MINKKIILFVFAVSLFTACKKTYKCTCTNENGSYEAGEVEGTKRQARKQCEKVAPSVATTCQIN